MNVTIIEEPGPTEAQLREYYLTRVCGRDPFCISAPDHEGECDQPFETEYREGAFSLLHIPAAPRSAALLPSERGEELVEAAVQQGLFG